MKKLLLITIAIFFLFSLNLVAAQENNKGPVIVRMQGIIDPQDFTIIATDEQGQAIGAENAYLRFEFPAEEAWEVSRQILFSYSSNLLNPRSGRLSFHQESLIVDKESSPLTVSFELERSNRSDPNVRIENGDTFVMNFPAGVKDQEPIGILTIKIRKYAEDVFTAGTYTGAFSLNYIDEG